MGQPGFSEREFAFQWKQDVLASGISDKGLKFKSVMPCPAAPRMQTGQENEKSQTHEFLCIMKTAILGTTPSKPIKRIVGVKVKSHCLNFSRMTVLAELFQLPWNICNY